MPDTISLIEILFSVFIITLAYVIRGISGFGSGLVAIPLLALMFPLTIVVPVISLLDYMSASSHGFKHRSNISWRSILPLMPFTLIGIVSALYLFKTVDDDLLGKALGVFILLFALYSLFFSLASKNSSRLWAIPAGFFGGFISALFGTGGPFYVIYMQLRHLDKQVFRATAAAIFFFDGSSRIFGYLVSGFYTLDILIFIALAIPVMILGLYIGGHIHTTLNPRQFQKGISLILIASGICSGLIAPDTLIRDNYYQLLRCHNESETNIQTVF